MLIPPHSLKVAKRNSAPGVFWTISKFISLVQPHPTKNIAVMKLDVSTSPSLFFVASVAFRRPNPAWLSGTPFSSKEVSPRRMSCFFLHSAVRMKGCESKAGGEGKTITTIPPRSLNIQQSAFLRRPKNRRKGGETDGQSLRLSLHISSGGELSSLGGRGRVLGDLAAPTTANEREKKIEEETAFFSGAHKGQQDCNDIFFLLVFHVIFPRRSTAPLSTSFGFSSPRLFFVCFT